VIWIDQGIETLIPAIVLVSVLPLRGMFLGSERRYEPRQLHQAVVLCFKVFGYPSTTSIAEKTELANDRC
jgi:hypothetical protein